MLQIGDKVYCPRIGKANTEYTITNLSLSLGAVELDKIVLVCSTDVIKIDMPDKEFQFKPTINKCDCPWDGPEGVAAMGCKKGHK